MKKNKKKLSLNKLVISKLNNSNFIFGGTEVVIGNGELTQKSIRPENCPTETHTCPDDPLGSSFIFNCGCTSNPHHTLQDC